MTEPEKVDQITREPSTATIREKDPKRVAAGKALAVKNKTMMEEHAKYRAEEAERNKQMKEENERYKTTEEERLQVGDSDPSDGFLSQLTLGNVLSLVGVGLSIYALFFKGEAKHQVTWKEPVETTFENQPKVKSKVVETKPRLKFGM